MHFGQIKTVPSHLCISCHAAELPAMVWPPWVWTAYWISLPHSRSRGQALEISCPGERPQFSRTFSRNGKWREGWTDSHVDFNLTATVNIVFYEKLVKLLCCLVHCNQSLIYFLIKEKTFSCFSQFSIFNKTCYLIHNLKLSCSVVKLYKK